MGRRILRYNVLLDYRHNLPVRSIVILLRREADGPEITGRVNRHTVEGEMYLDFRYTALRIWERPVEWALSGGLATLPLAPLAQVSLAELPAVIRRMDARIRQEAPPELARELWTGVYILMGLRYPDTVSQAMLKGVLQMQESTTYQAILREGAVGGRVEGRVEEARNLLLRLGRKRFGAPGAKLESTIAAISSVETLEQMAERVLEAETWQELLAP